MTERASLIFWGGWEGHEPEACAAIVADMLRAEGFATDVNRGTGVLAEGNLGRYDLIVPVITQVQVEKKALGNLIAAVEAGSGIGGFHGGMADAFRKKSGHQFIV
jgi:type 1 glutamine amidotransferase